MDVNAELYRPINLGNSFDKYFEKATCNSSFEKNGNTSEVVKIMVKDAKKFKHQTTKLSEIFKGKDLEATVYEIDDFLHNNIQYNIDDYDQNLRSPACSWASRKTGIDCKSYSIFASTILLNLGIPHSFRKVKQKHYEPQHWTHVYTVVNVKGKELVIDPTIHTNRQVEYIKKKDFKVSKLPIYTLNAGVVTPQPANHKDTFVLEGFFSKVLPVLERFNVSQSVLDKIEVAVKTAYYKKGGFSFQFQFSKGNKLTIDNQVIQLYPNGLNAGLNGLFDNIDFNYNNGDGSFETENGDGEFDLGATLGNFQDDNGNFTSGAISTGLDLVTGGLSSMIAGLIGFDIGEAVDLILSGHIDCIGGSSWEDFPQKIQVFQNYVEPLSNQLSSAKSTSELQTIINKLSRAINMHIGYYNGILGAKDWNSCSTENIKAIIRAGTVTKTAFEDILQQVSQQFTITNTQSQQNVDWASIGITQTNRGYTYNRIVYNLRSNQPAQTTTQTGNGGTGEPKETSSKTPLILGGLALTSLFIVPKLIK